ncbi:MAG TPA: hypothetical protein D7I06_02390 [Candidatus Poseidoniales archaeon]|nr:MAG TPA: hypothetical protein D7I06_02390 [Candidatus Poseidoniales archaeon]HII62435.1 hypothetical protein [Candidatus Poseidoniaceae archaeon]
MQHRQRLVNKSPQYKMMEKSWKALLYFALNEVQPFSEDEEESTPMKRTQRSRRSPRQASSSPLDWLPNFSELVDNEQSNKPFSLSALLLHKNLQPDKWESSGDDKIESLRESCLAEGVHKVWQKMAETTPIFAQFSLFSIAKSSEKKKFKIDYSILSSDFLQPDVLKKCLDHLSMMNLDPAVLLELGKVKSQLSAGRSLRVSQSLFELEGEQKIISLILGLHTRKDISDMLSETKGLDADYVKSLSLLNDLLQDNFEHWIDTVTIEQDNELVKSMKSIAWNQPPNEASVLDVGVLSQGYEFAEDPSVKEKIQWWKLNALVKNKQKKEAKSLLFELKIEADSDTRSLLVLLKEIGEEGFDWLELQLSQLDHISLTYILSDEELPSSLRYAGAKILFQRPHDIESSIIHHLIELFTLYADIDLLYTLVTKKEIDLQTRPYESLLITHLLPAQNKSANIDWLNSCREKAQENILETPLPSYFSKPAQSLLLLMEGILDDAESIVDKFGTDKPGLKAFKTCRQALKKGGDGLAAKKDLETLNASVKNENFSPLEQALFHSVISTLKLNRATWMLQSNRDEDIGPMLDTLLSNEMTPMLMMQTVRYFVLEYDLALPSLVNWYQTFDVTSPWHAIARAAVSASKSEERNAARDYQKAGESEIFSYEEKIMIYRKAMIHYAHAGLWTEALNLIEQEPALKSALTKRFQLYLQVSFHASQQETEKARKLLISFIETKKIVEDDFGESKERSSYANDDLDMLQDYPTSQPRSLPVQPFVGRVIAAKSWLKKQLYRGRKDTEYRYSELMKSSQILPKEVYDIADEAATNGKPFEGLMYLERAQLSGKFSLMDKKRLADTESSLFNLHHHSIPLQKRTYLRSLKLKPVVILDTNILIDVIVEKLSMKLGLTSASRLEMRGKDKFHLVLKYYCEENKIWMWIPKVVRRELTDFSKQVDRMHGLFDGYLVDKSKLEKEVTVQTSQKIIQEIIDEYSNWKPLDLQLEEIDDEDRIDEQMNAFLTDHFEIYDELTSMKRVKSEPIRTEIDNHLVYPESNDIAIMKLAARLAQRPFKDVGSLIIATRDGDFTLVARALEERFGFGVVKNSRMLQSWIN